MNRKRTLPAALCLLITLAIPASADQQVIYPPSAMPRVDMHTHMDAKTQYVKCVEAMDQWGGTISISLAGLFWVKDNHGSNASPASVRQIPTNDMVYVKEELNDRVLFCPGAFTIPSQGIWWSVDEIKTFKELGFVGLKLWPHGAILSSKIPRIHEQLDEAGRQGMPLVGYHTGDPGNAQSNNAAFPKFEDDTIEVAAAHPQTTFIFAHGLFMLENDQGMEKLAGIFDKHPNVFVDVAFTHNMRQPAHYTVSKAREFYIKYRDRILFGSDVFAADGGASGFLNERKLLETSAVTNGLHGGPKMEGLNLPDSVLNHIYYWNAARLIPRVRQVLEARGFKVGYELGNFKFDRLPPDVSVDPLTFRVGQPADLTGTLGSVTDNLTVEIAGKSFQGIDHLNGTWKLPADRMAGLPAGTYEVKVTAKNSIGLVRTDSTTNELTVVAGRSGATPQKLKERAGAEDRLSPAAFADPLLQVRPGCFWAWLNGSITAEQITRDLEAMKQGGMRGGEIWDVAAHADPDRRVPAGPAFLGPESTRLIAHAIREADRLGLELGLVASSGWNAGGSWITPEHAGKGLYQSTTTVTGPARFHDALPLPELPKRCPRDAQGRPIYLREVAVLAMPNSKSNIIAHANEVVDLTKKIGGDGKLRWDVPAGDWTILRFVCLNHGQQLIVPSPNSGGPMIDFFDPRATEFHLRHIVTTILRELGRKSFAGTSFKTMEFDSMELDGFTPWTETMAKEFDRHVGYSVIRFLPLLAGWKLADHQTQEQFLYDWRKFVSDRLIESHYATGREFLQRFGLKLIAESGGPGPPIWDSNPVDGIKALGVVDIPRGEFWIRHRGIFLVKEIASAAHVYGKRLVDAESFTTWRRWVDGPLNHKELADRALCEGLNCFSGHTFASSPPEAGLPGWAYHAGTDINPRATWWPMVRGLMDYLARCSHMLRQGWFVADVCYYYGDQAPNFFPPLCNVTEKPLLEGLDPRNDFDVCSSEVILQRMRVERGRIVLPDGMSYAALVLPEQEHIPSAVLKKIGALVADGATVIGHQRPNGAAGLQNREKETQQLESLVNELWGGTELSAQSGGQAVQVRSIGRGRFIIARDRTKALRGIGVGPDFEIAERSEPGLGPLDFVHRKTPDDELYFIRNKTKEPQTLTCRFRVAAEANGLVPEFWWPDSGRRSACHGWKATDDGRTELDVALGDLGSVFVVFRKAAAAEPPALDPLARDTFQAAAAPAPVALDGPWQVEFPEGWGAPRSSTFAKLQSWTESDNDGIRFFSGIATYRKSFELPESLAKRERLFLQLGDVAEIAEVTLNGKRLGLVWLPPYRIEISSAVRAGTNELEIRVANLWANRLNADSLLPESRRFTRSNLDRIQTDPTSDSSYGRVPGGKTRPVYDKIPPLMKSGLFGPVQVVTPNHPEKHQTR